ncbi:MAG TPA: glycosyltransferase family 87 protein [Burkholderiales bacterium]|nr:glycosyltransferase family 87 protein [Burkholderiales bacterium]
MKTMPNLHRGVLDNPGFRIACVLGAMAVLLMFGVAGLGHGGMASTNGDARFLYVAGQLWQSGLSAYGQENALTLSVHPDLVDVVSRYDFAYPAIIAPLCLLLASFPWDQAKLLMTCINVSGALMLGLLVARLGLRGIPTSSGARWLMAAFVIGNLTTAYVVWAGQTTILVSVALIAGWHFIRSGKSVLGGALIGVTLLKPQLVFGVFLWLILERRWKTLVTAAGVALLLAIYPISIIGPIDLLENWYMAISHYPAASYNSLGSRMVFGVQSILHALGVPAPGWTPFVSIVLIGALWRIRTKLMPDDILPLLVGVTLLFGYAHGYDLIIVLTPMIPAFFYHLSGRPLASAMGFCLFLLFTLPNSLLEPTGVPVLLHMRVLVLGVGLIWLFLLSKARATGRRVLRSVNDMERLEGRGAV